MSLNVSTETPAVGKAPARSQGGTRTWAWRLGFWSLLLALVGINAWLAWESRPLSDLRTISRLMDRELYGEAERALRAHLKRSPHDGEARIMLARALAARRDFAACAAELHQVPFWWPKKPEALFREGQMQMALGRAGLAEECWKACAASNPLHPTPPRFFTGAVRELAELYRWEQRRDDARELIWRAYQQVVQSDQASILIMSVWVELSQDEPAEAVERLSRFLGADADDWESRLAFARAQLVLGKLEEADREIQMCLKDRPLDLRAWRIRMEILSRQSNEAGFASALAQLPDGAAADPGIWTIRGIDRERRSDWQSAADAFRQAIRLHPWAYEAYYHLAMAEERLGEHGKAEEHRKRHQALRDAREELRRAYDAYLDAAQQHASPAALSPIFERLGRSCTAVGLQREGEAWLHLSTTP